MLNSDDDEVKEAKHLNYLGRLGVDGIILGSGSVDTNQNILDQYKIPFVVVDKITKRNNNCIGTVNCDNRKAAYLSTSHLISKGHKRIIFLCGAKKTPGSIDRFNGYCDAMNEHSLPIDKNLLFFGVYLHSFGYNTIKNLEDYDFSAICCMSDMLALGAMKALREKKISVPRDCAVIGCDDVFITDLIDRPLSSISRHPYDMGSYGMKILIGFIEQPDQTFIDEQIEPELIVRETT
jgi:LacI family transcriptional regulator